MAEGDGGRRVQRGNVVAGAILLVLALAVCVRAVGLTVGSPTNPQPGFFPFLGGTILAALAALLVIQAVAGRGPVGAPMGALGRPSLLVTALAVYVVILERVGYPLATAALASVVLLILETRSWVVLAVASLALAFGTYVLFKVWLGVELPSGVLSALL